MSLRALICSSLSSLCVLLGATTSLSSLSFDFETSMGPRVDRVNWTIGCPWVDTLSELTWKHMRILELDLRAHLGLTQNWSLEAIAAGGLIFSGIGRDCDYLQDGRQMEFSHSSASVHGCVTDLSLCAWRCYPYFQPADSPPARCRFSIGYGLSAHAQLMCDFNCFQESRGYFVEDGEEVHIDGSVDFKRIHELMEKGCPYVQESMHSPFCYDIAAIYLATWTSFFSGARLEIALPPNCWLEGELQFHTGLYTGAGDWLLREDISDFVHLAPMMGGVIEGRFGYKLSEGTSLLVGVTARLFRSEDGKAYVYNYEEYLGESYFNRARWSSVAATLGLRHLF